MALGFEKYSSSFLPPLPASPSKTSTAYFLTSTKRLIFPTARLGSAKIRYAASTAPDIPL